MKFYEIGPTPWGEECVEVGDENYLIRSISECRSFCNQVLRHYPAPNEFCRISIRRLRHDLGGYYEVIASVFGAASSFQAKENDEWIWKIENDPKGALENWDEQALDELGLLAIEI